MLKNIFFSITRRHRIQPPCRAGVGFGSGIANSRIELFLFRNQLYRATRGRTQSCRIVPVDGPLDSPASFFDLRPFVIIRQRKLVTPRWSISASIRARRLLAIFHSRHCEINFSIFFKRRRRARMGAENGHR